MFLWTCNWWTAVSSLCTIMISYWRLLAGGTRSRSFLSHWAASRKGAGSIHDGVIGIFHWLFPSGRIMALSPLSFRKKWLPITFMLLWSGSLRASTSWKPQGLSRDCFSCTLLYVDGRIILRWIFSKLEGGVGTGWSCLRIGTGGGNLWVRYP
jgi:hypothetical protein